MSGGFQEVLRGVRDRMDPAERWVPNAADRTDVVRQLMGADYISLGALFVAWTSALLLVRGEPNWALVVMFGAFGLDKLDGWYARYTGTASPFGRQVDSFIDVFVYLVTAALLYHVTLAPNVAVSAIVGFLLLAFGGLRLIRHNSEGFGADGAESYYHGTTVVHTNVVVIANYYLATFVGVWNGWFAALVIASICPLMVSDYKAYKTDISHVLVGLVALVAGGLALAIEFGYL